MTVDPTEGLGMELAYFAMFTEMEAGLVGLPVDPEELVCAWLVTAPSPHLLAD